jgi:hypothetical protein
MEKQTEELSVAQSVPCWVENWAEQLESMLAGK